ncbi:hypothetical protein TYRP_014870 [Tyrophagus putrescentiae]|nr:hypothetical protein TYRP_014870 [Tyrophagus putrescentiae]
MFESFNDDSLEESTKAFADALRKGGLRPENAAGQRSPGGKQRLDDTQVAVGHEEGGQDEQQQQLVEGKENRPLAVRLKAVVGGDGALLVETLDKAKLDNNLSIETASRLRTEAAALSSSTKALSRQTCPWRSQVTTRYSAVSRGMKTVRRRRSATASETMMGCHSEILATTTISITTTAPSAAARSARRPPVSDDDHISGDAHQTGESMREEDGEQVATV